SGITDRGHTLRAVVHGEPGGGVVTVPRRHGGVWFQGVVVGHRGRVGGFDRSGRVVERRVRIAGEGIGGVVRVHRFGFVEVITVDGQDHVVWARPVLHPHEIGGLPRDLGGFGDD